MRIKTSELSGIALDWAVAKCEGTGVYFDESDAERATPLDGYTPSTDWAQGGPIIEREKIRLDCEWNPGPWKGYCKIDGRTGWMIGPTPLIAAMRVYVAATLGDEIDVPEELL